MAGEAWVPQEMQLQQLVECLNSSLSPRDRTAQQNAELMIKQAKASLEIDNYLCFLLASGNQTDNISVRPEVLHTARSAAGIMLKNDIKTNYASIPTASKNYIHANILQGLRDSNLQIRNFVGNVVTELVKQAGILGWPDALPKLTAIACNDSGQESPEAQQGAASALHKVCEDNRRTLSKEIESQRPLDFLAPRLIQLSSSQLPKVRANALGCLNLFVDDKAEAILGHIDQYMQRVFELSNDPNSEVKRGICTAVTALAKVVPGKIAPHMENLVKYMLAQQQDSEQPELALEASEFWLEIAESKPLRSTIGPYLGNIIPVLLQCMIYDEEDVIRLEADAEDADTEDKEEDIKPQFATSKSIRFGGAGATNNSNSGTKNSNPSSIDPDDLSDGELEEYDEDDTDESPEDQWNLRKCSAAALDVFSTSFHKPVFDATLPYLRTNLTHQDWPHREAAVLAIGAIAEGCIDVVQPSLPELIPFLINLLNDQEPVVRKITCWSLGRYSGWAAHLDEAGKAQFFVPLMDGILKRMLDSDKRVQEAAASAFATLEEKSGGVLEDPRYCQVIVQQFAACFEKYKDRNMFILYDCVQTLAEHVGPTMQRPELVNTLMPALLKRWEKLGDQSQEMFPLLECLSYIAAALANAFAPFASPIFSRCIKIIYQTLEDNHTAAENPSLDAPNKDFLVTSLDLLSAVLQSLDDQNSLSLVKSSQPHMFDLLLLCLQDSDTGVKQSSYALLGDAAIYVFSELLPYLPRIMPILIAQLDPTSFSEEGEELDHPVPNNACWSCGEISVRAGSQMAPYVDSLIGLFYTLLCKDDLPPSLHENAAIALGRLGIASASLMAPHLATFAPAFTRAMGTIAWTDEKAQAMAGMVQIILTNPQGLQNSLLQFVTEISTSPVWVAEDATGKGFQQVLDLYTPHKAEFNTLLQHMPPENQQMLQQNYKI